MEENLQLLTDEQRNYFRHYEQMFVSQGWEMFKEQLRHEIETLNEQIMYTLLPERIPVARARRDFAEEMLRLDELVETQKQQLINEAEYTADQGDE